MSVLGIGIVFRVWWVAFECMWKFGELRWRGQLDAGSDDVVDSCFYGIDHISNNTVLCN